ncbi:MAG: asparagine synthase [Geobacteraceae bacterium]|nr:MAG: asparagine synthase [Geobacteraceae bacterium]
MAFEGVIYNARDLAREVGVEPDSTAHLLALLYERFGTDLFTRINGPCAVSIFDKVNGRATIATDRFGIRPIVYLADGKRFISASRIRDILAIPGVDHGGVDPGAVVDYLNLSAVPSPRTVYRNVRKLPPGHFLTLSEKERSPRLVQYYDIDYTVSGLGEAEILTGIPVGIEDAVGSILAAERGAGRQVGAFLSGGTDSSTVTGMIKKLSGNAKTFSIGFDEPGYNELDYARIAARHFGVEHHEYIVTPDDVLAAIDALGDVFDEPFGNASAVPTYFCAQLAREHGVDTLLAGDGGDEIFGGNERYAAGKLFNAYHRIPALLRKGLIEPLVGAAPAAHPVIEKGKKYIRRANIPQPDRFFSYNPVAALGIENIFSPDFIRQLDGHDPNGWARDLWTTARADNELNRHLYLDMKFTITDNDLRKVTGMTEKAGVRVAYPFLDPRLVDFAAHMPVGLKVKGDRLRYAFKESLRNFLPPEIIVKQKHGFGLPIGVWTRSKKNIAEFVKDALLGPSCSISLWLREGFLEEIFRIHRETGAAFYGDVIWHLLMLELWHKKYLLCKLQGYFTV